MKAWEIVEDGRPTGLSLRRRVEPQPGPKGKGACGSQCVFIELSDLLTVEDPAHAIFPFP
ncbi:MAG: hypothetical protein CM1200mP4_5050 [Rhodospirillaceae bacterium]|nr:MAG: hypothetical protein CM1200mP4_5050 [Rhodospirillaceae bacterium]